MSRLLPISLLVVCILQSGCSSEPTVDELLQRGRNAIKVEDWESVREIKNKLAKRKAAQIETQFLEANLYMNVLNYDAVMQRVGVIASDKRIREDCMMLAVHCFTAIHGDLKTENCDPSIFQFSICQICRYGVEI